MVNRLTEPTAGEVVVLGRPTREWEPIALRRAIGYVIQDVGLLPHFNILENVALVPRLVGRQRAECREKAREKLALVGLDPGRFTALMPQQLSGGQRQRVGVARALASEPELVLMDEPFGALDPITRRELQDEFRTLQRRLGTTVVLVTHDVREAFRMADRLALLDEGRLVQVGTGAEFRAKPANDFVRAFLQETAAVDEGLTGGRP
jgi:osmoprotectant transport system ATP-binding protein